MPVKSYNISDKALKRLDRIMWHLRTDNASKAVETAILEVDFAKLKNKKSLKRQKIKR